MDDLFQELIGVDSEGAIRFFSSGLRTIIKARRKTPKQEELHYVASVLAHYSTVSCTDTANTLPFPSDLYEVFDFFIMRSFGRDDPEILEIGGSQIILLAGFFRDQMKHRHNVKWYDDIGRSFYERASVYSETNGQRELFGGLSESLPQWNACCSDLSTVLRAMRSNYLLIQPDFDA